MYCAWFYTRHTD